MERFYFGSHVEIGLEWKRETSMKREEQDLYDCCLLYTSDAADDWLVV